MQPQMLDVVMERVRRCGLNNVFAQQGDATLLPYSDRTFDAAYMSAVLGEIPDRVRALLELHRVIKPGGRLVIAEVIIDPDYISLRRMREETARAGFSFEKAIGPPMAFAAMFRRGSSSTER